MRNLWTEEEIVYLTTNYPNKSSNELAEVLNRSLRSVYSKAKLLQLKKSLDFLQSEASGRLQKGNTVGAKSTFKKGHLPPNKGKKIEEFMNEEQAQKFKANSFKKDNTPHNACKDWEERIVKFKGGNQYIKVKVPGINKLVFKHHYVFIQNNGSIPENHIVAFKDGNSLNVEPINLVLLSKKDNMARNTINRFPEELKSVIRLLSKLNKKTQQNEKQD